MQMNHSDSCSNMFHFGRAESYAETGGLDDNSLPGSACFGII